MASRSTSASLYAVVTSPITRSGVPEDAKELSHHLKNGKGFRNPWPSWTEQSAFKIVGALLWRMITGNSNKPDTTPPTVPVHRPTFLPTRQTSKLRATWLGHACYYVEFSSGLRILFDPVFTPRCSPFSFMGPKRYTEQPCSVQELPYIDAVIISHAHYDHLSLETVQEIHKRHPNVHFFVPLRNKEWFTKLGIENVTELDWWEERELRLSSSGTEQGSSDVNLPSKTSNASSSSPDRDILATISCLPCQHIANRGPFDRGHTLWASWSVTSGGKKLYFAGDTGYRGVTQDVPEDAATQWTPEVHGKFQHCPAFEQIGRHRGPFDVGLIPIGAYSPRFIMSPMHANPFDSVNIFKDTRCNRALSMHWGTWVLTEEDVLEPPRILKEALRRNDIQEEGVFDSCDIGESRDFE